MMEIFNGVLSSTLNKHAPLTQFKVKTGINSTNPWYSVDIDRVAIDRDNAKRIEEFKT